MRRVGWWGCSPEREVPRRGTDGLKQTAGNGENTQISRGHWFRLVPADTSYLGTQSLAPHAESVGSTRGQEEKSDFAREKLDQHDLRLTIKVNTNGAESGAQNAPMRLYLGLGLNQRTGPFHSA